jgi:putative ABC transport system ATP-binding protein
MTILELDEVTKRYQAGTAMVEALRGVSLQLEAGDFVALMGPSGCGKSTLLHLSGAMDTPTTGRVSIEGREIQRLGEDQLTVLRRERLGFVFQFFNLLPTLTVRENVELPLLLAGDKGGEASLRARQLLTEVQLDHRMDHYPQQLSGGEMQRAAIARAIIHRPALLIADEPTGNLDSVNGAIVLSLLQRLHREAGLTILMATHSQEIASSAQRILQMKDGQMVEERLGVGGGLITNPVLAPSQTRVGEGLVGE